MAVLLLTWPVPAAPQSTAKIPRIGYMSADAGPGVLSAAFLKGLGEVGWVEGQSITIEYRWAAGQPERYPALAAELAGFEARRDRRGGRNRGSAGGAARSRSLRRSPGIRSRRGSAASLARPGGNVTGLSMQDTELSAKRLQLLKEAFPRIARVAVLHDPEVPMERVTATEAAGRSLGLALHVVSARRPEDLAGALEAAKRARADALIVLASSVFNVHRVQLVDLVAKHRLLAVYEHRLFPEAGGLMSYGPDLADLSRRAAVYVDKILRGARPADLPIEQPTKFDLVVNPRTARSLEVAFPESILGRATDVVR